MKKSEMRSVALGAARSKARIMGLDPMTMTPDDALAVLDDVYRVTPDLIASLWYESASDTQIDLFHKEWKQWQRSQ